tara:strand:- start:188 stop:499 length:312 start_codon:yes stop_codon:yes gene_type:complete
MTKDHFKEPLPPGVKNLDDFEIHFPEHNLKDYVMHSPKSVKQSDTNYDKDIQVDNVFIAADKHEEQMKITEDMVPDFIQCKEDMYETEPEDWINDPEDPPIHW